MPQDPRHPGGSESQDSTRRSPLVVATVVVAVLALVIGAAIVGGFIGGPGSDNPDFASESRVEVTEESAAADDAASESGEEGIPYESESARRSADRTSVDGEEAEGNGGNDTGDETADEAEETTEPASQDMQALLESTVAGATGSFGGSAAIAVSSPQGSATAGDDSAYPAWSTIKVPIAIAALRQDPGQIGNAMAAITYSDNASAAAMFNALPAGAADSVLAEAGVPVVVNTAPIRPEFSTFGQTALSTSQEAVLASNLRCVSGSGDVVSLMGQIAGDQSYGLGTLPGARFKGGWGPSVSGGYQVRQFGLVSGPNGDIAIALTAIPGSGSYGDGQAMLNSMAAALSAELGSLPTSAC